LQALDKNLNTLKTQDISNLAELRNAVKTKKKLQSLAQVTGIEEAYLVLLRREINSYFPKPIPLKSFDWLPQEEIEKLENTGIKNTAQFYARFVDSPTQEDATPILEIKDTVFEHLLSYCDLTRMQWTSPLAARMYFDAGYESVQKIKSADPDALCAALTEINAENKYFKGNIGLRDIKRLIKSANYL